CIASFGRRRPSWGAFTLYRTKRDLQVQHELRQTSQLRLTDGDTSTGPWGPGDNDIGQRWIVPGAPCPSLRLTLELSAVIHELLYWSTQGTCYCISILEVTTTMSLQRSLLDARKEKTFLKAVGCWSYAEEMGTALSISPTSRKAAILDEKTDGGHTTNGKPEKSLKRNSVIISALTWKRLVAASAKKKSTKKVNPNPPPSQNNNQIERLNNENIKKSQQSNSDWKGSHRDPKQGPLAVPVPTVPNQNVQSSQAQNGSLNGKQIVTVKKQPSNRSLISPRRVIVQASTGELLRCLSEFMCRRCFKLKELSPNEIILWFRNVDRSLLIQGWQDQGFITPANLVFVYLLCREAVTDDIDTEYELQATFLTCLYLAYSYMGNEISYPLKPFLVETNKELFWERSLKIIDKMSAKMLQINSDPHFFTEVFQDLKNEAESRDTNSKWTNNLDR
ncbi:hypothetical protein JZ751_006290, partial [Albula glossodonta]